MLLAVGLLPSVETTAAWSLTGELAGPTTAHPNAPETNRDEAPVAVVDRSGSAGWPAGAHEKPWEEPSAEYLALWKRYPNSRILPPRTPEEKLLRDVHEQEMSQLRELIRKGAATPEDVRRYYTDRSERINEARVMLRDRIRDREAAGDLLLHERENLEKLLRAYDERIAEYESRIRKVLAPQ